MNWIRASVPSILLGSAIGGFVGSLARFITSGPISLEHLSSVGIVSGGLSVILSIILSVVAVIFMARKSDAQSFVSVEDFWGEY
jgi:hypothetical protein